MYRVTKFLVPHNNKAFQIFPITGSHCSSRYQGNLWQLQVSGYGKACSNTLKIHPYSSASLEPLLVLQSVLVRVLERNRTDRIWIYMYICMCVYHHMI